MSSAIFYVDESGDLGWKFTAPYRKGGSSRYLTIATLVCPSTKKHLPKRLITKLYNKCEWKTDEEKKWSDMTPEERKIFAGYARKLLADHQDIKVLSITVAKENVLDRIRKDSNKLYNYMINLSLIDEMSKYKTVILIPDERALKVRSGNSLHDYLGINLAFEKKVDTVLQTTPCDSSCSKNLQFTDMIAGLIQNHYEDHNSECLHILQKHISPKRLYFDGSK